MLSGRYERPTTQLSLMREDISLPTGFPTPCPIQDRTAIAVGEDQNAESHEVPGDQVTAKVSLLGEIRCLAGKRHVEVCVAEGSTVQDLLNHLAQELGSGFARSLFKTDGTLHRYVKVFLGGDEMQGQQALGTKLDGKQVDILVLTMYTGG